jgi:hypothetical protein
LVEKIEGISFKAKQCTRLFMASEQQRRFEYINAQIKAIVIETIICVSVIIFLFVLSPSYVFSWGLGVLVSNIIVSWVVTYYLRKKFKIRFWESVLK